MKRSLDGGKTWSALRVIADHGGDTIGNPTALLDRTTGTIWLLLTGNPGDTEENEIRRTGAKGTRTVWITSSRDEGQNWDAPREITSSVKRADWMWYATGPGNGIQLRNGRLVVPCNHTERSGRASLSHIIYSDDNGKTWRIGGSVTERTNECAVAELSDGTLLLNMRNDFGKRQRAVARSRDGGETWGDVSFDDALIDPTCEGSMLRSGGAILFSNAADERKRVRMTVRLSRDEGRSWPAAKVIWEGPSAYSSMTGGKRGKIGLLFECGVARPYESIVFISISLKSLALR